MKKMMFNDKYGLTAAVLAGTKTQTRRIVPQKAFDAWNDIDDGDEYSRSVYADSYNAKMRNFLLEYAQYKVGEVVAVAQSYKSINFSHDDLARVAFCEPEEGWNNKMFVKAELMPHQIRIENVKVERLQDISGIDCIAEGIYDLEPYGIRPKYTVDNLGEVFLTEKEAYAALIDRISGKGTWERNPYVFVYDFHLIKKEVK